MSHLSHVTHWLSSRDTAYMALRANALLKRYGLRSRKAKRRAADCVSRLTRLECRPTLPTPGRVIAKYPRYFQQLQAMGAELAMHGYDHVDFRGLSREEIGSQFSRATAAFQKAGIRVNGFRCPYLGCTDEVREVARESGYVYSSNTGIQWNVLDSDRRPTVIFEQLNAFYQPSCSDRTVSVPRIDRDLVEIPASGPDDLQLFDGLGYQSGAAAEPWLRILDQTHRRGELFVLVFHPEALGQCGEAIERVVREALCLKPCVWVATLRDIARWWLAKSAFGVQTIARSDALEITFQCDSQATVLVRGLRTSARTREWLDQYHIVDARTITVSSDVHPFIGIASDVAPEAVDFLKQQGYILDTSGDAQRCSVYLDGACMRRLSNEVQLIQHVESLDAPLVRYWPWPHEARSALSVTGDLDALSLMDYAVRIVTL